MCGRGQGEWYLGKSCGAIQQGAHPWHVHVYVVQGIRAYFAFSSASRLEPVIRVQEANVEASGLGFSG